MKTKLKVEGMSCEHCVKAITGAVGELSGVNSVEVSLEDKTVAVDHADQVTLEILKETIEDQGYDVL